MDQRSISAPTGLSRRRLLGLGASLTAGIPILAGCRTEAPQKDQGTGTNGKFDAPNFVPPDKLPGAIISDIEGVSPAYSQYPSDPARSVSETPGKGGTVSTFQILFQAPAPKKNPWLTEFDKRLGVELKPTFAAAASYGQKLQTLVASGDIPDLVFIERNAAPAIIRTMQQGAFTDLTEVLAGKGIDPYPNLARIPTYSWRNSAIEGQILGIPRALPLVNQTTQYRKDWAEDLGLGKPPADAEEVKNLLVEFTKGKHRGNKKRETWGLATLGSGTNWAHQMFRIPNGWRLEDDGTLTNQIETDEFEAALVYLVDLWKAGAFHPDAATLPVLDAQDLFMSGRIGLMPAGITPHYRSMLPALRANDPKADVTAISPPGHDGGDPVVHQENGYWGVAAIPAETGKDKARLEELLRILDYWCAPFGSEEHTFINYGLEGRHFNFDKQGNPVTVKGDAPLTEVAGPSYMVQPLEAAFFFPGDGSAATEAQKTVATGVPLSIKDPTLNLISETDVRQSAALDQIHNDYEYGIITGRRPMSDLKAWRDRWRKTAGDKIRKEFEEAL